MKQEFCVAICPHCDGNGLLYIVKDEKSGELHACCDECYQEFINPNDIKTKNSFLSLDFNNVSVDVEVALNSKWKDYIYVLENGKWLKYTDKSIKLF